MRLCEVELELKRGDKAHLFDVARLIARALPAQLALTSKSERGYLLCDGTQGMPAKFAPVTLTSDMPTREGFREIGRACLWQIVGNEPAVLKDDAEGIHQMRLGSSKLRTAISLFSAILPDPQTEKIETELEWLASELGSARELEALMARALMPVRRRRPGWDDTPKLSRQIAGRRAAALDRVRDAIASQRYRLLKIDIAAWLEAGAWAAPQDVLVRDCGELPIKIFAAEQLSARGRKIRKRAKSFADPGAATSSAFWQRSCTMRRISSLPCFQAGARTSGGRNFSPRLRLCRLVSATSTESRLTRTRSAPPPRRSAGEMFAAGALSGRKPVSAAALLATTQEALDRFAKAKPFWG
jgi:triphosphatase